MMMGHSLRNPRMNSYVSWIDSMITAYFFIIIIFVIFDSVHRVEYYVLCGRQF